MYHWKNTILRGLIISSFLVSAVFFVNEVQASSGFVNALKKVGKAEENNVKGFEIIGKKIAEPFKPKKRKRPAESAPTVSIAQQRREKEAEAAREANARARAEQAKSKAAFQQRLRAELSGRGQNQPFGESPLFRK